MQAEEVRFEIDRRHRSYKLWVVGVGAVCAIIGAVFGAELFFKMRHEPGEGLCWVIGTHY
jgi:hypothetical protein